MNGKAFLRWWITNIPLMFMALVLAVIAWMVAVEESDPTVEDVFPQTIPVTCSPLPDSLVLVGSGQDNIIAQVRVTLRAPQSVWDILTADDFVAQVDVTGLNAGHHELPVQVTVKKQPARIVRIDPTRITLELQSEVERAVPVQVTIQGKPTLGYLTRTPIVTPREVVVHGPRSYVEQVTSAVVQVSVQDASTDVEGTYRLRLVDADKQVVPYVRTTTDEVEVQVPIELSVYYRPLVIKVVLEGQFASGYRITDISVDPPSVTVFGAPNVIAALPGYIETAPINLDGVQDDVIARPALIVPPDVSLVLDEQPVVRVSIDPILSSLTRVITPEIQGLGPGLTATVSPTTVEMIVSGPMPLLDSLQPEATRVVLNLRDLSAGVYQLEPQAIVPVGVTAQGVNPATVQVEITAVPTSTTTLREKREEGE